MNCLSIPINDDIFIEKTYSPGIYNKLKRYPSDGYVNNKKILTYNDELLSKYVIHDKNGKTISTPVLFNRGQVHHRPFKGIAIAEIIREAIELMFYKKATMKDLYNSDDLGITNVPILNPRLRSFKNTEDLIVQNLLDNGWRDNEITEELLDGILFITDNVVLEYFNFASLPDNVVPIINIENNGYVFIEEYRSIIEWRYEILINHLSVLKEVDNEGKITIQFPKEPSELII